MDVKLALSELKASIEGPGFQCHIETYLEAIGALEKQVPQKPKVESRSSDSPFAHGGPLDFIVCPSCGENVQVCFLDRRAHRPEYCNRCGQALDWSDYEC